MVTTLESPKEAATGLRPLVGENVIEKIPLVARYDSSVLISGETGTGKELIARAIGRFRSDSL